MLLSIEKLIYGGDGLARTPAAVDGRSMAVFVPFVLPGEKIEAEVRKEKPGFAHGSITHLIEASPDRVEARCPYFRQCGGCHYQHIPYERQLEFKAEILRETLQRIAKNRIEVGDSRPRLSALELSQSHAPAGADFARVCTRLFQFGSHKFLAARECPISSPLLNRVIARLLEPARIKLSRSSRRDRVVRGCGGRKFTRLGFLRTRCQRQ